LRHVIDVVLAVEEPSTDAPHSRRVPRHQFREGVFLAVLGEAFQQARVRRHLDHRDFDPSLVSAALFIMSIRPLAECVFPKTASEFLAGLERPRRKMLRRPSTGRPERIVDFSRNSGIAASDRRIVEGGSLAIRAT